MPVKHPLQYPASHNDTKAISHRKRAMATANPFRLMALLWSVAVAIRSRQYR